MNVLQVTNFYKPSWDSGGLARSVYELSTTLSDLGHQVTVYTTDGCETVVDHPTDVPVSVDDVETYYFKNLSRILAEQKITTPYKAPFTIRNQIGDFDVVHLHGHRTLLAAIVSYYAFDNDIPVVLKMGGTLDLSRGDSRYKQFLKLMYDRIWGDTLLSEVSTFIARSESEKEELITYGIDRSKIQVIHNAIRPAQIPNFDSNDIHRIVRRYGVDPSERNILFLGRLHPIKGIDLLIESFAKIDSSIDEDLRLIIVGPDEGIKSDLIALAESEGVAETVTFTGPIYGDNKYAMYRMSDAFVIPSKYEAFPTTLLEAGLSGTPVLISDQCSISKEFENESSVITFKRTPDELSGKLMKVLNNDSLAQQIGSDLCRLITEEFTWRSNASKLVEIYKNIVMGSRI